MEERLSPAEAADTLRITLLGSFRLLLAGRPVPGFDQARLQQLLAYLLLNRGSPVPRQQLAFLFWPDSTEEQARTNLRNLWHRLRRALPGADLLLATDELAMQWRDGAPWWLDVAEFERHLARAGSAAGAEERLRHLEQAVADYGGELLPGCYDDWLLAERERLAQAYGRALEELAALYEDRRDYRSAIGHAQALLRHDSLHEPAYARLMRLHALNDDRAAALHTYHSCATVLRRELDAEPDRATREFYEQLLSARAQPLTLPLLEAAAPLVGRDGEWALLQRAWRQAAGRPGLVLIAGEAGIGKTRLAEAMVEWAARQGIAVLTARCYAGEGELAYAPLVAWLRAQPRPRLPDRLLRELARFLPEILVERPDLPPPEPLTENWQRLRLYQALADILLAGRPALLLFLDDLQWCDGDTLEWLHFLLALRHEPGRRVHLLVMATLEPTGGEAAAALDAWTAGPARSGQLAEVELGPLTPDATLALADRVAGRLFDRALGPLLYQGTEGHPLFVVEMVRAGFAGGAPPAESHAAPVAVSPPPLPDRVRQVLQARLAQLSPPARGVVELASVIGRAFPYAVLAQATDLSEGLLVDCLDECWRKRILREQQDDAYDFAHGKLREAAYAGLSRARRRWLHGRVARALEAVHAGDLERVAGAIAGHFEAAGLPGQAVDYLRLAAAAARRVYAHAEALAALEKAIGLLEALPPGVDRSSQAAHLHEAVGELRDLLAQHAAAREAYAAARTFAPPADGVTQARLLRKAGKALENERAGYEQVAAQYASAEALLGAPGQAGAETAWWEEWCQVQLDHLLLLYWWKRPQQMAERIAEVRPWIERHGTPAQRAALFGNLSRQINWTNRFAPSDRALAYACAARVSLPGSAAPEARAPYEFALGFNLLWHGNHAEAEAELRAALDLAEQIGDVALQARCLAYLVAACRRQGREADVELHARRGLVVAEAARMLEYVGACRAGLAWVAWRRRDLVEAGRLAEAALEAWAAHTAPYPFCWQALWPLIGAALANGRLIEAAGHARRLCDSEQQLLPPDLAEPLAAALSAWDAGRAAEAGDLLRRALDRAQQENYS